MQPALHGRIFDCNFYCDGRIPCGCRDYTLGCQEILQSDGLASPRCRIEVFIRCYIGIIIDNIAGGYDKTLFSQQKGIAKAQVLYFQIQ